MSFNTTIRGLLFISILVSSTAVLADQACDKGMKEYNDGMVSKAILLWRKLAPASLPGAQLQEVLYCISTTIPNVTRGDESIHTLYKHAIGGESEARNMLLLGDAIFGYSEIFSNYSDEVDAWVTREKEKHNKDIDMVVSYRELKDKKYKTGNDRFLSVETLNDLICAAKNKSAGAQNLLALVLSTNNTDYLHNDMKSKKYAEYWATKHTHTAEQQGWSSVEDYYERRKEREKLLIQ